MPGRGDPQWAVFLTCVLSHLPMLPTVVYLYRRRMPFECVTGLFAVVVSFMYHTCETFETTLYLRELQWHRLDNIGAITSLVITCVHLACFEDKSLTDYIKITCFLIVVILQEGYPWDVRFTAVPVVAGVCIPVLSHVSNQRRRRQLIGRRLLTGVGLFLLSMVFFVIGLDDQHDPYRIFHGLFHMCVAAGVFSLWSSLRPHNTYRKVHDMSDVFDDRTTAVIINT